MGNSNTFRRGILSDDDIATIIFRAARASHRERRNSAVSSRYSIIGETGATDKENLAVDNKKSSIVARSSGDISHTFPDYRGLTGDEQSLAGAALQFVERVHKISSKNKKVNKAIEKIAKFLDDIKEGKHLSAKSFITKKNEAVLALTEYGEQKSWLLSGWETNVPDAIGEVGTQSEATQFKPTFSRQELGAGISKILQNLENASAEGEKNEKNVRHSVDPGASLREERLTDMMMPFVGDYLEHDGEYYAQKILERYDVKLSPAEAFFIAGRALSKRRSQSVRRSWQLAMDFYRHLCEGIGA